MLAASTRYCSETHSGRLVYTEASGASHRLDVNRAAIAPAHPASAPIRSGRFDGAGIVLLGGG